MAAATVLTFFCRHAFAFPSSRLEYTRDQGAEHCPDEMAVRMSVAARLGYDPFVSASDRTIVAHVMRESDVLKAVVELVDATGASHGRRELTAPVDRCEELVYAMALSISLAIDPERAQARAAAEEPSSAGTEPMAAPARRERRPPNPVHETQASAAGEDVTRDREVGRAHEHQTSLSAYSGAGGLAVIGTAPSMTGGVFVFAGVQSGKWSLALEGRYDAPGSTSVDTPAGARVSSSLIVASLMPCFHSTSSSVPSSLGPSLFACASVTAGVVHGTADDVTRPKSDDGFYSAAGGRIGAELPLYGELRLRLHVDLWAALTRVELDLDGRSVWRAPALSASSGLALMARFR